MKRATTLRLGVKAGIGTEIKGKNSQKIRVKGMEKHKN